jgi:tetratricopeptide (TPR) repeat protein
MFEYPLRKLDREQAGHSPWRVPLSHKAWFCETSKSVLLLLVLFCVFSANSSLCPAQAAASTTSELDGANDLESRIGELIRRLSDSNYSTRISAQAELERIGVVALDQLHAASFHPDPQIASSARYIVQSNQFTWAWDTDPVAVRQILVNYATSPYSDKSAYIDQLQRLEHDQGFAALCRLVRYETQSGLAKRAALLLLRGKPTIDPSIQSKRELLFNSLLGGQSQASQWILKYVSQGEQFDLAWWQKTLQDETALLEKRSGETNLELVADLNRWIVEQIAPLPSLRPQALVMARSLLHIGKSVKTLDSVAGHDHTRADEFAQWALKNNMPELIQEQHANLAFSVVSREFNFGYYLAESFLLQNRTDLAQRVADLSLKQIACNERGEIRTPSETEKRDPIRRTLDSEFSRSISSDLSRRAILADKLKERGHFEWAEAEYRSAIYPNHNSQAKSLQSKPGSETEKPALKSDPKPEEASQLLAIDLTLDSNLLVLRQLAEMVHSQGRFSEAANVLEPFVERFEKEPMFRRQLVDAERLSQGILTSYHLYRGDEAREANDIDKAKSHYWKSIEQDRENVDALIGLYKLELPELEQTKRRSKLKEVVREIRNNIRDGEESLKHSISNEHAFYARVLSNECNTLAWLIANTEGSKEEALFLGRKACVLHPESAEYYDTLAHCYAALGKYQDAVQQQLHALEIKPHHPELRKALSRFEAKLPRTDSRK